MVRVTDENTVGFQPMEGFYEPSGIQQLPDGRFLVVEDEASHPFSLVTLGGDGRVQRTALGPGLLERFSDFWHLEDLEGVTQDRAGFVYAITSHSRDDDGDEKKSRERLVRFRVDGDRIVDHQVFDDLKAALTAKYPVLAEAAGIRKVKAQGGLNIEAVEVAADQQSLLIGFRSPLHEGRALVANLENHAGVFERGEAPWLSNRLIELDLGGAGIRSLSWVPAVGYLVVGGPVSRDGPFSLWHWNGEDPGTVRRVSIDGVADLERAEGLCAAMLDGRAHVVIVSDDGDRKAKEPAHLLVAPIERLRVS